MSLLQPVFLLYVASMGATEQIVRVLAKDLGARQITVNAIAPGPIDTESFRAATAKIPNTIVAHVSSLHPTMSDLWRRLLPGMRPDGSTARPYSLTG